MYQLLNIITSEHLFRAYDGNIVTQVRVFVFFKKLTFAFRGFIQFPNNNLRVL